MTAHSKADKSGESTHHSHHASGSHHAKAPESLSGEGRGAEEKPSSPETRPEQEKEITISGQALLIGLLVIIAVGLVVWKIQAGPIRSAPAAPAPITKDVVARINGEEILRSEITRQVDMAPQEMRSQLAFEEVLNATIRERALIQEAKRNGIEVPANVASEYLMALMNESGISEEELYQRAKEKGIGQAEIVEILSRRLMINALLKKTVFPSIHVSQEEIKAFYEKNKEGLAVPELVHAKHILLAQPEEANATLARLRKGAEFEALAKDLSIDKGSARFGGDLGNFTKGMMVPEFEQAAFEAKPGALVGPVKTAFGYHIIKVVSHTKARERPLKEVEEVIHRKLKAEKSEAAAMAYSEGLVSRASIEIIKKS